MTEKIIVGEGGHHEVPQGESRHFEIDHIDRVDLKGITDVLTHRIMRDESGVVHEIEFVNQGRVKISYTFEGKLREFHGRNFFMNVSKEYVVTIGILNS